MCDCALTSTGFLIRCLSLQGYFHPLDTMEDVRSWLNTCLYRPSSSPAEYDMDLYTTPPRTSLGNGTSLQALLHLVPAAVVYVSWRSSRLDSNNEDVLRRRVVSADENSCVPAAGWNYLNDDLFQQLHSTTQDVAATSKKDDGGRVEASSSSASNKRMLFPVGRRLAEGSNASAGSKEEAARSEADRLLEEGLRAEQEGEKGDGSGKKKPK